MSYLSPFRSPIVGPDLGLYRRPQETLPAVKLIPILRELLKEPNNVPIKNVVILYLTIRYMGTEDVLKILKNLLSNGKLCDDQTYGDNLFKFCLRTLRRFGKMYQRGSWWRESSAGSPEVVGQDLFSIICFICGCSHLQSIKFVAEILGVSLSQSNLTQPNSSEGYTFIEQAHAYTTAGNDDVVKEALSQFFVPIDEVYDFCNMYGKHSCSLKVWRDGKYPFQLFMTKHLFHENGKCFDTFIAPPTWKNIIYNLHLIYEQKNEIVYIHDDISRTKDWQGRGINTWSGELEYIHEIGWSILQGRSLKYVFDPRRLSSFKIGARLIDIFNGMGTRIEAIACEAD